MTQIRYLAPAILLFVFVAYALTLQYPFFFDDYHFIVTNGAIQTPANLAKLWTSATYNSSSPDQWGYRPLTTFMHSLAWLAGGGATWPFHVLKKLLHAGVCILLFEVWRRLWSSSGFFPSNPPVLRFRSHGIGSRLTITPTLAAAALAFVFAIHPANNEVVNYISATTTLLCGFCYITAYYFYLRFRESDRGLQLGGALLFYGFATLAKEEGITLCAIVALTEIFLPLPNRRKTRVASFFAMAALLAFILKSQFMESSNIARGSVAPWNYFMTQWRAYLHYLGLFIWPWDLNADNLGFGFSQRFGDVKVLAALAGNLFLLFAALSQGRRYPVFLFALLWFYIAVSPASSVIPLAEPVNDRRMYLAFFGVAGIFPWILKGIEKISGDPDIGPVLPGSGWVAAFLFLALLVGTEIRNGVWTNNFTLWSDTVEKNPYSARAMNNLALDYMRRAQWPEALDLLTKCGRYTPSYVTCKINEALVLEVTGRLTDADEKFRESILLDPQGIENRNYYAEFLAKTGKPAPALVLYRESDSLARGMNLKARVGRIQWARALGSEGEANAALAEARTRFGDRAELRALDAPKANP